MSRAIGPSEIVDSFLWIGNQFDAANTALCDRLGITHYLCCAEELFGHPPEGTAPYVVEPATTTSRHPDPASLFRSIEGGQQHHQSQQGPGISASHSLLVTPAQSAAGTNAPFGSHVLSQSGASASASTAAPLAISGMGGDGGHLATSIMIDDDERSGGGDDPARALHPTVDRERYPPGPRGYVLNLLLRDGPHDTLDAACNAAYHFINDADGSGGNDDDEEMDTSLFDQSHQMPQQSRVLVYCRRGQSRSVSIVIAYLMRKYHTTYDECLAVVRDKRSTADPNAFFSEQLRAMQLRFRHHRFRSHRQGTNGRRNSGGQQSGAGSNVSSAGTASQRGGRSPAVMASPIEGAFDWNGGGGGGTFLAAPGSGGRASLTPSSGLLGGTTPQSGHHHHQQQQQQQNSNGKESAGANGSLTSPPVGAQGVGGMMTSGAPPRALPALRVGETPTHLALDAKVSFRTDHMPLTPGEGGDGAASTTTATVSQQPPSAQFRRRSNPFVEFRLRQQQNHQQQQPQQQQAPAAAMSPE